MKHQKPIIKKSFIKEHTFDNGGYVLNASFDVAELMKLANNGKVKIIIKPLKQPSELGSTHIAVHDDWTPSADYKGAEKPQDEAPQELQNIAKATKKEEENDLPF